MSPFDPESKVYVCSNNRYICKNTGKSFNVKTGTIFENTKLPLRKWFMAIWLVLSHKKGISSLQLSRDIKVVESTSKCNYSHKNEIHPKIVIIKRKINKDLQTLK